MRRLGALVAIIALVLASTAAVKPPRRSYPARSTRTQRHRAARRPEPAPQLPCGDVFGFQVLLDRHSFSPGEIDGKLGTNFGHALTALQQARRINVTGQPDCDTWHALGGDNFGATTMSYTVTADDLRGPFIGALPHGEVAQAELPALGYTSPLEEIAERFHVAPPLLQQMNPGMKLAAGDAIQVPAVTPFDPSAKPGFDPAAADITIQVSRDESALRATHADGSLVFFAPVSSGSVHDPLPIGNWKVTSVNWWPVFHYNPKLFWDAKPSDSRTDIKPGPNNPVGVVWIAVNLEHYGLHGTPEPGRIGYTQSHGCVRLTNWDAARVASLVQRDTPVVFK